MHPKSEQQTGTLYVVATPIGNLADITERAKATLQDVDMIACEDTRHTGKLLHHLGIQNRLVAVHDHNERDKIDWIASCLEKGQSIALVSDAGTPLISDPGYPLVSGLRERGMDVQPVPGVSAIITALSGAGLPTDRFTFEGFLAHKSGAKRERLETLNQETRTMVFYESKHRILDTLKVMIEVFGLDRKACVAREMTKTFETFYPGSLAEILELISAENNQQKGEFVVMITGNPEPIPASAVDSEKLFKLLLKELPPKKAASVISDLTGENKKELYQKALEIQGKL
jgi:16S rRNA (cytidine1402-2'-O)-methyltransferase